MARFCYRLVAESFGGEESNVSDHATLEDANERLDKLRREWPAHVHFRLDILQLGICPGCRGIGWVLPLKACSGCVAKGTPPRPLELKEKVYQAVLREAEEALKYKGSNICKDPVELCAWFLSPPPRTHWTRLLQDDL